MLKAYKGNKVLRIEDSRRAQYESMGYTIKTMDGQIVSAPVDKDAEIAKLKAQIAHLQKELAEAKAEKGEDMSKYMNPPISEDTGIHEDSNPADAETALTDEKPKKKRARKQA